MGLSLLRRAPRSLAAVVGLAMLLSVPAVRAEDPVDTLKATLADRSQGDTGGPERLEFRRAKVKEAIDQMKTIGQLRRSLMLDEWKVDPKRVINPELRDLDSQMRAIVGDRLKSSLAKM